MYDDDKLNTSETYFTVLQLLRVFGEWVLEPKEDIRKIATQVRLEMEQRVRSRAPESQRIIMENWATIQLHAETLTADIVSRIERKMEEVQSLRDGVSSNLERLTSTGLT